MAKDPAFLLYSNDFSIGTQFFTDEQVGQFIRLLLAQHQHGHLSEKQVLFICKTYDNDIISKFKKDDNNCYYNERLDAEILKRKLYSKSRSDNRKGDNKEDKDTFLPKKERKTYVKHMENENENEIDNKDEVKNEKKPKKINSFNAFNCLKNDYNIDEILINDFLEVRKSKKAPLTQTALNAIINECNKHKFKLSDALTICCEKNWQTFKYEWHINKMNISKTNNSNNGATFATNRPD